MLRACGVRRGGRVQPWPAWVAGGSSTPTSMCELSGSAGWMAGFGLRSGLMAKPVTETSHGWVLRRRLIRSRLSARRNESPAGEWFRLGAPLFHRRVARGERWGFGPPGAGLRARVNGRRAPGTACRARRRPSCSARRSSQRGGFSPLPSNARSRSFLHRWFSLVTAVWLWHCVAPLGGAARFGHYVRSLHAVPSR